MTPDKNQNINLLPADLQRKQQVVRQAITSAPVEYTAAANGKKPARAGFFNRFRSRPKSTPAASAQLFSTKLPVQPMTPAKVQPLTAPPPAAPPVVTKVATEVSTGKTADKLIAPFPPAIPPLVKEEAGGAPLAKTEAKKKSSEAFDVNLLSGEYAQAFAPQNQKFVFITSVAVTAFIIILGYAGVYLYQLSKEASARSTALINEELKNTIASYAPLEAEDAALQKKVAGIKSLLAGHVSFKDFLVSLEAATIPEVTYTAIAVSKSGAMSLTALATDYTALARQLAILQKDTPWVITAIVTGATLARDNQAHSRGVEFEISLKVDPLVFKPAASQ